MATVFAPADCDDADPTVFPGATEVCDGADNDCNGLTDEDVDGDGFGACRDCDETDTSIHRGADERCNAVDGDCDGEDGV